MKKMDKMANVATPGGISTACSAVADSVSTSRSHGAEFFAVASGVQIPYVGRDETGVNASRINSPIFSDEFPPRLPQYHSLAPMISLQNKQLPKGEPLAKLAELFSQYQPLADRRAKKISHSYLKKISSDLVFDDTVLQDRAPHTLPYNENDLHSVFKSGGICNAKTQIIGLGGRHDPRGVVKRHALCHLKRPRKLKPLRREKTSPARGDTGKLIPTTKLKEIHSSPGLTLSKGSERHEWDEYVLACLSQSTAKLIINEQPSGSDKERLTRFVEKRIRASQGKTADGGLSDGATEEIKTSAIKEKAKDVKCRESKQTLEIHYSPSFTLPPAVGDKKLKTDNIFQQELLGGAQPVSSKKPSESSYIILDTNDKLKFQRQLQENYPQGSEVWYSKRRMPVKKATEKPQRKPSKLVKGLQRWKELPVVVQDDYYAPVVKESDIDVKTFSSAYKEKKKMREDSNVVKIVEEWRSKWFLESHWQRCETEELIKAMGDINDHIRLSAVSACSKATELRHSKKQEHHLGILLDKSKGPSESLEVHVEPELISAVTKLLDDRNPQVRVAAAITLYSLKKHNDDAESILLWAMEHGGPPEKWAATQCLALSGVITDKIIVELVSQLHADNAVRTEKAGNLLAQLSHQSDVVQTLIAELLNSNSWKDRLTACKVIPKLRGGPNKDMTQKLSYLMWNDWSKDVRSTAAQALGKTGNGRLVHDALRERMLTGNDRIKVDALKKLSNLGIMTARLLPALQECFKSEYVSVRIEAAMVAGKLKISDQGVLNSLLRLASEDDSWKVKAHTIKALGAIGLVDEKLIEVLLWSIRYERVPAVRAEACNAVATLGLRDERLLSVLQDRLVVETEDIVKREAIMTLESLGVEPTGDKEMIEAIRQEVKRLCKRDVIVAHILKADQAAEYKSDYKRLLIPETEEHPSLRVASQTTKLCSRAVSRATSESSRGFDPIVAGYHARERMSRAPTPGELIMKRSLLPLDLNSTSSENSDRVSLEKWEDLSDESDIDEGSGNELGPNGVLTEAEKLEEDNDLDKKRESASCVISASQPTKNDLSEGQKVTLPSADAGGNDCQNSQISSEVELDKDYTELPKPNDEMSERTISLPGFSDTEQCDEHEDNFRSDVHPTQHNGP